MLSSLDTPFLCPRYNDVILNTPGLKRFFPLNEGFGTVARDLSASRTNITYTAAPILGRGGPASLSPGVLFNGTSQYCDGSDAGLPTGAAARSLEAWVKTTQSATNRCIVAYGKQSTTNQDFEMRVQSGVFSLEVRPNIYSFTKNVADGLWHHCVITTADGITARGYVDGIKVGADATISPTAATVLAFFQIGVWFNFLAGTVSAVAAYDRALLPGEIAYHNAVMRGSP